MAGPLGEGSIYDQVQDQRNRVYLTPNERRAGLKIEAMPGGVTRYSAEGPPRTPQEEVLATIFGSSQELQESFQDITNMISKDMTSKPRTEPLRYDDEMPPGGSNLLWQLLNQIKPKGPITPKTREASNLIQIDPGSLFHERTPGWQTVLDVLDTE